MVMTDSSRCSSGTKASLPRASSNLELLSKTAAWKNDLENPARVSPSTELAAQQIPSSDLVSPTYYGYTIGSTSPETSPSISSTVDGHVSSPFISSVPSSFSWTEKWNSMMFPINNESSNSFDEKNLEEPNRNMGSSAFCLHPQAVHAAFAPPVSSGNNRKRISSDESESSNKRLVVSTAPDGSRVSVTTTTTTVIRQPGLAPSANLQPHFGGNPGVQSHGSLSSCSGGSTTPSFVIEPSTSRGGTWPTLWTHPSSGSHQVLDELARDNALLRYELGERNRLVDTLQQTIEDLQAQVDELRQLPVGKISQIPVADMVELMHIYGSEVSDHTHLPAAPASDAKRKVQKASIVRQFRRWNPNFHEFFHFQDGKWAPKLGVKAEQERRAQNRALRRLEKVTGKALPFTEITGHLDKDVDRSLGLKLKTRFICYVEHIVRHRDDHHQRKEIHNTRRGHEYEVRFPSVASKNRPY